MLTIMWLIGYYPPSQAMSFLLKKKIFIRNFKTCTEALGVKFPVKKLVSSSTPWTWVPFFILLYFFALSLWSLIIHQDQVMGFNFVIGWRMMWAHCSRQAKLDNAKVVPGNSLSTSFPPIHPFSWSFISSSLLSWWCMMHMMMLMTLLSEAFLPNRWRRLEKTLSRGKPVVRRKEDLKTNKKTR